MQKYLICPYCGEEQDTGDYRKLEKLRYHRECDYCEKVFMYTIRIHYSYSPHQARCLNGEEHEYEASQTSTEMLCVFCGDSRMPTREELGI